MVDMVTKLGMIGLSEGNGHPYSFSAIINGYDRESFATCGWPGIFEYLEKKVRNDFGIDGLTVSAVWTQDIEESRKIAQAARIESVCHSVDEMVELVDGVIIARDDWQSHWSLAEPFLKAGKYVFVDKPLSLSPEELKAFYPYLVQGQLMSCAALRYAGELDEYRYCCRQEQPKVVTGTILCDWSRYGVHLLDGIFSGIDFDVQAVFATGDLPRTAVLECSGGTKIVLTCLGSSEKTFNISGYFDAKKTVAEVADNFTAFKRTLEHFRNMIRDGEAQIDPELTLNIMKTLIAGELSYKQKRLVYLDEIEI
jgi:predicted dehydrogenase